MWRQAVNLSYQQIARLVNKLKMMRGEDASTQDPLSEYLDWLLLLTPGMLSESNLKFFKKHIPSLPHGSSVLEIGSFCGQSILAMQAIARHHNRSLNFICVDPWIFEGADTSEAVPYANLSYQELCDFGHSAFLRNCKAFGQKSNISLHKTTSDSFFSDYAIEQPISMIYIDGNHSSIPASKDFMNAVEVLAPGGIILCDDTSPTSGFGSADSMRQVVMEQSALLDIIQLGPNLAVRKK